jgi:hypothetical protein
MALASWLSTTIAAELLRSSSWRSTAGRTTRSAEFHATKP